MELTEYLYPKNGDNSVHYKISVGYPCDHAPDWELWLAAVA